MKRDKLWFLFILLGAVLLLGAVGTNISDFFMPGSQDGQSGNLESPNKCDNCHGGYDQAVEPAFNWRGSMMAQAMRDPLFIACLAIANQDAPESGDLCIRCHAPDGWLNGRSIPTDGSALNNNDRQGVQCDFCHKLVKPSELGVNPYPGDPDYTNGTYLADQDYLAELSIIPPQSGNGMYIAHSANAKRGPFTDAAAKHQINYSPFHSESAICGTCHDVSNPVFSKMEDGTYMPNTFGEQSPSFDTYMMLPTERTYSEWKMSDYNTAEGVYSDVFGGNKTYVSSCQDCHMMDVTGYGANKNGTPLRNDLPLHDMTGGNTFVPDLVAQLYPSEVDLAALEAGKTRARGMLQNAATLNLNVSETAEGYTADVEIINETGHKLPSGYPEGRRMWINLQAYDIDGVLLFESGAYDAATAELTQEGSKIYEIKLGMSQEVADAANENNPGHYQAGESFHFVLNNEVLKDNRIPPRGFTNENFNNIQSPVVDYSYADGTHWDNTLYDLPPETFHVKARLFYQTVSKEYIEFLRDENVTNDAGQVLYDLWEAHGKSSPELMNEADVYLGTPPTQYSYVDNITFARNSFNGGKKSCTATVYIVDDYGNPLANAVVEGTFSGPTSDQVSGTTDVSGVVALTSSKKRNPGGEWCLNINDVILSGYEFAGAPQYCESPQGMLMSNQFNDFFDHETFRVYPNPASSYFNIHFDLQFNSRVQIEILDMQGKAISSVRDEFMVAGKHDLNLQLDQLSTGSYIIRLKYGNKQKSVILNKL
jgi:cytochrome c553